MPSRVLAVLLLTAVLLSLISPGLANSWGLTGPLYAAVSSDRAWKDYTTLAPQQGDLALLGSRDHNALFYIDPAGRLQVCHTAVWQPQDAMRQSLQGIENGFILTAGEETFTFRLTAGRYLLQQKAPCLIPTRSFSVEALSPAADFLPPAAVHSSVRNVSIISSDPPVNKKDGSCLNNCRASEYRLQNSASLNPHPGLVHHAPARHIRSFPCV